MEYTTTVPYRAKTTNPYTDGTGISLPILFNGANLFATSPLYRKGVWGIGNTNSAYGIYHYRPLSYKDNKSLYRRYRDKFADSISRVLF